MSHLDTDKAVEAIAAAYLEEERDALAALEAVVRDALADLTERERRIGEAARFVSRGYIRGREIER
ncbi:hypothetical protein [Chelatococcus asaccharovorans]|uniref:Uncharacterized protein n=1 Tax=Chelatococcus asaccharovorans TaxID=28210 RepID=A0A2V3UBC8_9HYPH|nr:hypothetical protein [Chelatococcus asaccharovorans]MBS7703162.1 hypothetical protein [Chelatococcus asaccharovorans]PXW61491.1 hypothetical protein C7450_1036 [Chelatococcus asaccharovorans]